MKALEHEQKRQRQATKTHFQGKVFDNVRGFVSFKALDLVYTQIQLAKQRDCNPDACLGNFTASMGLPCKHVLKPRLATGELLSYDLRISVLRGIYGLGVRTMSYQSFHH